MIDLISIHIPRTAGTSFYQILQQVYGEHLSISLRRKDIAMMNNGGLSKSDLPSGLKAIHGHLYYAEAKTIHLENNSKIICWLREPAARVMSNYRFFINGLHNPQKNLAVYQLNKHRIEESLIEYARLEENCNRMSKFLDGIALEDLFFFGTLESFQDDVRTLSNALSWPEINIPHLNSVPNNKANKKQVNGKVVDEIRALNALDYELYSKALELKERLNS